MAAQGAAAPREAGAGRWPLRTSLRFPLRRAERARRWESQSASVFVCVCPDRNHAVRCVVDSAQCGVGASLLRVHCVLITETYHEIFL